VVDLDVLCLILCSDVCLILQLLMVERTSHADEFCDHRTMIEMQERLKKRRYV